MNPIMYNEYKLSNLEYIIYGFLFLTISAVLSILFYDSFIPVIFSVPCMPFYFRFISRYLCIRRRQLLVLQFRDIFEFRLLDRKCPQGIVSGNASFIW